VVTAEVGVDRHKIAYFGDVVNTTGRLEAMSRTLNAASVASTDLLDRLPGLPPGVTARPLGSHALRGRDEPIAIAALERAAR
jgi:adenylate cyclase